jgi:hypothetical protein
MCERAAQGSRVKEHAMNSLDASLHARGTVTVVALSTALSGCYYYAPYGYVPYDEVPMATQPYPFTMPDAAASGTASDAAASTNTYIAAATPVFVEPAYYPVAYPYYGWPWWGPSVSLSFGYWGGGCCYGGGHHGYWRHGGWGGHGYWGHHGHGGGWAGHGDWGGGGGGHYWGGGASHGPVH